MSKGSFGALVNELNSIVKNTKTKEIEEYESNGSGALLSFNNERVYYDN